MSSTLSFTTASNDYKRRRVTKLESEFSSAYEPHQIVFGIFENSCSLWHRQLIAVSADNTFEDLATILCDKVLPSIRGDDFGGNSVNEHLWYFEFGTENPSVKKSGTKWIYRMNMPFDDEDDKRREFSADSPIGCLQLKCRMHARLTYDLGTTSTVFMKVLAIGELDKETEYPLILHLTPPITTIKRDILFPLTSDNLQAVGAQIDCSARFVSTAERNEILSAVPAFSAPEEVKLDVLFPNFSRAFLHEKYTSFVIGLSSMITRPSDGSFLAMDGSQNTIMLAPIAFTSMNEFFAVINSIFYLLSLIKLKLINGGNRRSPKKLGYQTLRFQFFAPAGYRDLFSLAFSLQLMMRRTGRAPREIQRSQITAQRSYFSALMRQNLRRLFRISPQRTLTFRLNFL